MKLICNIRAGYYSSLSEQSTGGKLDSRYDRGYDGNAKKG